MKLPFASKSKVIMATLLLVTVVAVSGCAVDLSALPVDLSALPFELPFLAPTPQRRPKVA